jgi:uncharacterized protein (DUF433 family)
MKVSEDMMSADAIVQIIPIETDAHGVIRIGGTRVTLDSVVYSFREGATAEEIVQHYPVLKLADVYVVIGYYLKNRKEIDADILISEEGAEEFRRTHAQLFLRDYREKLLSRQKMPQN